jgi:amino acid permease
MHSEMASSNMLEDVELDPRETNDSQPIPTQSRRENFFFRAIDSFKSREQPTPSRHDGPTPVEGDTSPLNRSLKGRHLQFIAIGDSIGAGLFIGCGKALAIGGPASLLIAFSIVGVMLLCVMHALGELAAIYPISGIICEVYLLLIFNTRIICCVFYSIY